jgi:GDP-mannose transporter
MIYTSTKALQYLSVPVYTIFKNITIIVIAYGEARWFNTKVTSTALTSFTLIVLSSMIAAWAELQVALGVSQHSHHGKTNKMDVSLFNAGSAWMSLNVLCTAAFALGMRRTIQRLQFTDWDSK